MKTFPNPFNGVTNISFVVEGRPKIIGISVFDISGRMVRDLGAESYPPGYYTVGWDGRSGEGQFLSSGIYLVQLNSQTTTSTAKVTFVK